MISALGIQVWALEPSILKARVLISTNTLRCQYLGRVHYNLQRKVFSQCLLRNDGTSRVNWQKPLSAVWAWAAWELSQEAYPKYQADQFLEIKVLMAYWVTKPRVR